MPKLSFPKWLLATLLVLATLAVYWQVIGHDFVNLDDPEYVTSNAHVQRGLSWENIRWACSNTVCCNWHPLTVWSHMLDCQVFGLRPWGPHVVNVLLHAFNALLVFALLQLLTHATWRSLDIRLRLCDHATVDPIPPKRRFRGAVDFRAAVWGGTYEASPARKAVRPCVYG